MSQSSIWAMGMTLSNATTPGQSRPGNDDSDGVLRIPQGPKVMEPQHQIV